MSNPFKDEEPMSVFKESPSKQEDKSSSTKKNQEPQGEYSQFPSWDLLPPFKLVSRGRKK